MEKSILGLIFIIVILSLPDTGIAATKMPSPPTSGWGVLRDTNCNQSQYYPIGKLCADTDDGKLYKGTGAAVQEIGYYDPTNVAITGGTGIFSTLSTAATKTSIFTHTAANYNEDGATWTITGTGPLVHVTGNTTTLTLTTTEAIVAGTTYKVTVTGTGGGATATYTLGGVQGTTIAASGAIAIEDYLIAATTASLIITPATGCTVSITSITVEKLTDATGDATIASDLYVTSQIVGTGFKALAYPSFTFRNDRDTGMLRYNTNSIGFVTGGSLALTIETDAITTQSSEMRFVLFDATLYRDASHIVAQKNATSQQTFRIYNTADAHPTLTNYERLALSGVIGTSLKITAETAGTGADNLDIVITPAGTGEVKVAGPLTKKSNVLGTGGGLRRTIAEATSAALSGASVSIAVNVPSGARIHGVQLRVDTAVTSGDGATSWTAAYVNTPTTAICSGQAFTKDTKFNTIHPAYELTTGTVTIAITPNSGTFSAGVIRAVVYYEDLVALSNTP